MKYKHFFWIVIIIGFLASSYIAIERYNAERSMTTYEITMPYDEIVKMAAFKDIDMIDELNYWKEAGINSVSLSEMTLRSLYEQGLYHINLSYEGNDVVVTADSEGISRIKQGIQDRLSLKRKITQRDKNTLVIEGAVSDFYMGGIKSISDLAVESQSIRVRSSSLIEYIGLGFDEQAVLKINQSGLLLRLRPSYVTGYQDPDQAVANFMTAVDAYSQQPYIIFGGHQVLAADGAQANFIEALNARDMSVGMIESPVQREHLKQTGIESLVSNYNYKAVRVFSTWDYIRDRYDYKMPLHHNGEEVMNTFYRAITERNINVIYFKSFTKNNQIKDLPVSVYQSNFKLLEDRLAAHGIYNIGSKNIKPFYRQLLNTPRQLIMFAALSVVASLLLLVNQLYKMPKIFNRLCSFIGFGGIAGLYMLDKGGDALNLLFGFLCTISFASLSMLYIIKSAKHAFDLPKYSLTHSAIMGLKVMLASIFIAFIGAITETAFFAESKYLLEMSIFRGVKLSQMAPLMLGLIFTVIIFIHEILSEDGTSVWVRLKTLLNMTIKLWQVILGGIVLMGLLLFVARSGHESGIEPSNSELLFRNMLEFFLYARPRTKAFIIGFPAIIFFIQIANQKKMVFAYPVFAVVAGIGQTDILNTFSHIRTMLDVSIARVAYEVIFGIGFYGMYFALVMTFTWGVKKMTRHYSKQSVSEH